MQERSQQIQAFLTAHGWGGCERIAVKGDASFRRYERLKKGNNSAILMDAPPKLEDVHPFIFIGTFLKDNHLSAPIIYAADVENGFLILEDFGDDVYGAILSGDSPLSGTVSEMELYRSAVDVLTELHSLTPPPGVPYYDTTRLLNEASMMVNWYLPAIMTDPRSLKDAQDEYTSLWKDILATKQNLPEVLVLRDYHSPNLMWLPNRNGIQKVGLLDFQDAVIGSPAYDLVSLLADARRDVSPQLAESLLQHYLAENPHLDKEAFLTSYTILGAQRNFKVIGFVTKKLYSENNSSYLHLFPRMWRYLEQHLKHPIFASIKDWLDGVVPEEIRDLDTLTLRHRKQARA